MTISAPAEGHVVVLAGGGALPSILVAALARAGRPCRIIAFRGFADRILRRRADAVIDLLDVSRALDLLDTWKPGAIVLAGTVTRPHPSAFFGALTALRNTRELRDLFSRGDDHLLRAVVGLLEEKGHRVIGAHDIAPELLAPSGTFGRYEPDSDARISIRTGFRCLEDLSPYDIGQALVVLGERVTAIEGAEGTDRMLARVAGLSRGWFTRRPGPGGVLVKSAKTGQERRVDLPAVGPRTVKRAAAAGLSGIAIGAGQTLVVEREEMIKEADRRGLFIVGFEPDGVVNEAGKEPRS
jgi:DUF1009 family protein